MYTLLSGLHPFASTRKNKKEMFEDIKQKPIEMLDYFSDEAKDLIMWLLERNPFKRLGMHKGDMEAIKNHQFFCEVVWDDVYYQRIEPPFIPDLAHEYDVSYMDRQHTRLSFASSVWNSTIVDEI